MHTEKQSLSSKIDFPIVGIGASAGGLDAFKKFLENVSAESGMAYVLVQHLAPEYESLLPEILSNSTHLPVHEIHDDISLMPNHIYIIPENKILTAIDGVLKLSPRDQTKRNMPIDVFFKSIAEVHKSFAVGVVFSGNGFDGSEGLKSIKELGGITYAQTPETAAFDSMPQNALNSGAVDFTLPPEDIAQHLLHISQAYKINHAYADDASLDKGDEDLFKQILRILRLRTGNDFTHYKQPTLRRRIARRMVITKREDPQEYLKYLREKRDEQDALFNDILIPVSYFFRDTKTFDTLCEAVFPLLLKNKKSDEGIRFWVAGCSTGEEAYSLAICLHEYLSLKAPGIKVQIFASDISDQVIAKARTAMYSAQDVQNIPEARLKKYFTKTDGNYHINKVIRDMCVFAVHNFLKDPPFAKMDLISCRNVLIYFDQFLQKKAMNTFHYALKEHGILFLGKSETTSSVANLFEPLVKNQKIFARKSTQGRFFPAYFEPVEVMPVTKSYASNKKSESDADFHKIASEIIFSKYTPAGVIINENKDIVHFHGNTGPFLVSSPGKPNFNVLKMAREGLAFELRNALLKAKTAVGNIKSESIQLKGENYLVSFEVIPLGSYPEPHMLVLFHKRDLPSYDNSIGVDENGSDKQRIRQLEAELEQMRDDIRRVSEDQEAVNEELQSANEELLSNSEELQSLNEELETSAEELQSNNEELISVNDELIDRQDQLISSRMYAEAIVETIKEPLIVVDKYLRIKSANSSFYKYFKVTEQDTEGRLFYEIGSGQWDKSELRTLLANILPLQTKLEDYEVTTNFPHLGDRTMLLNVKQVVNGRHSEQLILIAFDDITELRIAKILRESEERFRSMADTTPIMLWVTDAEQRFNFFNKSWLDFTGRSMAQEAGNGWCDGVHPDDIEECIRQQKENFERKKKFSSEYRLRRHDGTYRWVSSQGLPRFTSDGEFLGFIGGSMDIDGQKNASAVLEARVAERTSALKESESFLQSVLNTTQNLIYLYDFELEKIIFVNKKSADATGYSPEEIQKSKTDLFTGLIHPDDLERVKTHRINLKNGSNAEMQEIEFRLKNTNGEWAYQLSRDLVFNRDAAGRARQYIGVATDITELRNANEQLIVKNRELEGSNTELNSFSSIASHDLKEPLRKIMLFSNLVIAAEKDKLGETSAKYLERVIVSADRLQQLIDDLISYSRAGTEKIKYTKVDLNRLLKSVRLELKDMIEAKKAVIEIQENLPVIPALVSQMSQLFINLISNALKYSKKDEPPYVKVTCEQATAEALKDFAAVSGTNYYKITIFDNGIGFSNEYKDAIFEAFKRLHGKDDYPGTGIGLAICKKIVINHKGFITSNSEPGKGSEFIIFVPDGIKRSYP